MISQEPQRAILFNHEMKSTFELIKPLPAYEKGETQSFYNGFFEVVDVRRRSRSALRGACSQAEQTLLQGIAVPAPKLAGVGRVGRIDLERHSPFAAVQTSNYFRTPSVFVATLPGFGQRGGQLSRGARVTC